MVYLTIREIRKNDVGGRYTFRIIPSNVPSDKTSRLVAEFRRSAYTTFDTRSKQVNFEVENKRIIQLAQDILKYFDKKAKWDEWKPTLEELEQRLNERYHGDGIYMWLINWVRMPWNKKAAKRIFEWLEMANEHGFFDKV